MNRKLILFSDMLIKEIKTPIRFRGCSHGVMVKALDCRILVSEFKLQSCYYNHYWTNAPWERYESLYPPSYG